MTLDLDVTYVLVLALFLVPLLMLNALVFKPFLEMFEARHERLEGALERASRALDQAAQEERSFKEKIGDATREGIERRNALRIEAETRMRARVASERAKIQGRLEGALDALRQDRADARARMQQEAERIAELTATKLLGRSL